MKLFILIALFAFSFSSVAAPVNLKDITEHARRQAQSIFGRTAETAGVYFHDGAAGTDLPIVIDRAEIDVLIEIKEALPDGLVPVFRVGFNGVTQLGLVKISGTKELPTGFSYVSPVEIIVTLDRNAPIMNLIKEVANFEKKNAADIQEITLLRAVRILTIVAKSPTGYVGLMDKVRKLSYAKAVESSHENYRIPFVFDRPILLGDGKADTIVDPDSLRTISKEFLTDHRFTTDTTIALPEDCGNL